MTSWSTFAEQHARLRAIVSRIVHRDVAAALMSWRDYMRRMSGARALLRRVVTSQKQLCWDTWWQYATQVPTFTTNYLQDSCQGPQTQEVQTPHANGLRLEGTPAARGCPRYGGS